jgi:hypothetical protein
MSRSGDRRPQAGGVDEMKWEEVGWDEGSISPSEEDVPSNRAWYSTDVEGFARSFDMAFVCETSGWASATELKDFCKNLGPEARPSFNTDFCGS